MNKWEMVRLGDVCDFNMGQSPSSESYNNTGEGIPFFQGRYDFGLMHPTVRVYCTDPKKIAQKNDILISVRAPVGSVNIATESCCIGRGLATISQRKKLSDYKYIYYYLKYKEDAIADMGVGSTFKAISKKDLDTIQIPLPPVSVQQQIADMLDCASTFIEKRKTQIEKLDLLVKSQFVEMFGDPERNEQGWEMVHWDELFNTTTGKLDSNAMVENGDYPFFTCAKEIFQIDRYAFDCEALLLAGNNAAGIYDVKYYSGKFNAYQRTYVITLKNNQYSYLPFKLMIEWKLERMRELSKGTNTKYLTMGILNDLKFITPPLQLQNRFADFVRQTDKSKLEMQQSLSKMELNYKSLVQKCFKGELFNG